MGLWNGDDDDEDEEEEQGPWTGPGFRLSLGRRLAAVRVCVRVLG